MRKYNYYQIELFDDDYQENDEAYLITWFDCFEAANFFMEKYKKKIFDYNIEEFDSFTNIPKNHYLLMLYGIAIINTNIFVDFDSDVNFETDNLKFMYVEKSIVEKDIKLEK